MNLNPYMIYIKIAAAAVILGAAGIAGYRMGATHWQEKYDALQAQDWQGKAKGEELAKNMLAAQLKQLQTTTANNSQVINDLQQQNDAIRTDRDSTLDLAHRLLANAARLTANPHPVPETGSGSGTIAASGSLSNDQVAELLADVKAEYQRNADQLDALIKEILPQL